MHLNSLLSEEEDKLSSSLSSLEVLLTSTTTSCSESIFKIFRHWNVKCPPENIKQLLDETEHDINRGQCYLPKRS